MRRLGLILTWLMLLGVALLALGIAPAAELPGTTKDTGGAESAIEPPLVMDMPEAEDIPRRSVRIRAVGDLMCHQRQLDLAWVGDGAYDFVPAYALAVESLSDADYTIANLETTIGLYGNQPYSGFPRFNSPESLLAAIKGAGVDFLTLANNHMLDRYFDGMVATVDHVEAFGFDHGGAYRTQEEADAPVVVEVGGIRIGFLCYAEHTNGMESFCDAKATQFGIDYLAKADFAADVAALRALGAKCVIALPHWGTEYVRQPDYQSRAVAEKMIAAGVDVILGSHPHMVQPMEFVTVETGDGPRTALVAWSMGNFIDNMKIQYTDSGIIVDFTIAETDDGVEILNVGYVPIYCWRGDDQIRALPSGLYLEKAPDGMGDAAYSRMKASYDELVALIGDGFAVLEK